MKSDMAIAQLRQYKEYGESVLQSLELVSQNPPPQESWFPNSIHENIQRLKASAQRVVEIASSPVKIGVMGEFSSGKTLLIGSLIGYADALPVSETPTTGNVTAIHLRQQPDLQTTQIGKYTVHYLSDEGVKECLRFMLQEVEVRAKAAELSLELLASLKNLHPTKIVDSNGILRWCEQAWNQTQSLELRSLLRELVVYMRTYNAYGKYIGGKSYEIDHTTAKKGLRLAEPPMNILELSFDQLPAPPQPWANFAQPSAVDLHKSFSLIRRIDVTVEVSKEIWDLSALQGTNEFVLLDFPGLGSADSGVRDTFLSLRELTDVQTLLLLLNGRYPGGAIASKIRTMLERDKGQDLRDRIIVGVGRFNQLPLTQSDERALDELIDEPLLSEANILESLGILQLTIASASNLTTEKKNIVLLSQLHGLAKLAELSSLIQVSSPEFLPELDIPNKLSEVELREKWQQLSKKLPPSSTLHKQLSDFAEDGGISRLRSLLKEHVAQHGLKQLVEDTQRTVKALQKEQDNLKILLEQLPTYIPVEENPKFIELRHGIENLVTIYRQFQEELEKQPILKNRDGVAVSDVVKDELTNKIFFEWSEWTLLFDRTKNGTISLTKADSIFGDEEVEDTIPTKSDDFHSAFVQTIQEMQTFAHDRTTEAVTDFFKKLSIEVADERTTVNSVLSPDIEQYIQNNFGKNQLRLFRNLLRAVDPINKWQKLIIEHSGLATNHHTINADTLFPLARQDEKHPNGQIFDWSPDKKYPTPPRPFNHQIAVLRLRDEITASAGLHLVQYVSQLTKQVKFSFSRALKEIVDSLQELLKTKHEPLLRYIADTDKDKSTSIPPWLETLSQVAIISDSSEL
ncbi:dynamin family protein [Fischerella thermalis]|uniref:dynamin family protein n=1 Tax=Fischerella thermalis TaxID=372787 RepID=UPI000C80407F|nr:dynamin family protein [Fischerella thermalis]PLZ11021.1 dynamin family protein [Fischerella thermalis WC1110]PLZ42915.1 dynamin family protein [Fischerella thermalis WC538]PLZ43057.1 dynamin family protein [Fischerella thermalis WC527]PLZ67995.1 dynamin family protein [Fischerella thermalis WC249]